MDKLALLFVALVALALAFAIIVHVLAGLVLAIPALVAAWSFSNWRSAALLERAVTGPQSPVLFECDDDGRFSARVDHLSVSRLVDGYLGRIKTIAATVLAHVGTLAVLGGFDILKTNWTSSNSWTFIASCVIVALVCILIAIENDVEVASRELHRAGLSTIADQLNALRTDRLKELSQELREAARILDLKIHCRYRDVWAAIVRRESSGLATGTVDVSELFSRFTALCENNYDRFIEAGPYWRDAEKEFQQIRRHMQREKLVELRKIVSIMESLREKAQGEFSRMDWDGACATSLQLQAYCAELRKLYDLPRP